MTTVFRDLGFVMGAILALADLGCGTSDSGGTGGAGGWTACTDTDPFCHRLGETRWGDEKIGVTFLEAKAFCEGLNGKMPGIADLRTLFVNCPATEPKGACGVTDDCATEACKNDACGGCGDGGLNRFGSENPFWSATAVSDKPGWHFGAVYRYSIIDGLEDTRALSTYCIAP